MEKFLAQKKRGIFIQKLNTVNQQKADHQSPQEFILVGPPVSRSKQRQFGIVAYKAPIGAEKIPCSRCGNHLWLGPTQLQFLREHIPALAIHIYCFVCATLENAAIIHLGGRGGDYQLVDGTHYGQDNSNN